MGGNVPYLIHQLKLAQTIASKGEREVAWPMEGLPLNVRLININKIKIKINLNQKSG